MHSYICYKFKIANHISYNQSSITIDTVTLAHIIIVVLHWLTPLFCLRLIRQANEIKQE